jgi:hypothetical protein
VEAEVRVAEVQALKTKSGNTRFVLRDDAGGEYSTFREEVARQALAAEGRRARITYHESERGGYRNVYLDSVEPLEPEPDGEAEAVDEVAWKTAVDAAPWLVGGQPPEGGLPPDELFDKLKRFKELVADDIRSDDDPDEPG